MSTLQMSIIVQAPAYINNLNIHQLIQSEIRDFLILKVHPMKSELKVHRIVCSQAKEILKDTISFC